ncbi:PAS domain S-box protein [Thermodesulfobacteriota bacterium B35]
MTAEPKVPPPLARRVNRLLALFFVLGLVLVSVKVALVEMRQLKLNLAQAMSTTATTCSAIIADYFTRNQSRIRSYLNDATARKEGAVQHLLSRHRHQAAIAGDLFYVLDQEQRIIRISAGFESFIGLDLGNMPVIRAGHPISPVHQSMFTEQSVITMLFPLDNGQTLAIEKNLDDVRYLIRHFRIPGLGGQVLFFILTGDGTVVYHPDRSLVESRARLGLSMTDWSEPDSFGLQSFRLDHTRYLAYRQQLELPPSWTFYAAIPYPVIIRHILRLVAIQAVSICATLLAMIILLNWLINRYLARPISDLAEALAGINPFEDKGSLLPPDLRTDTRELRQIVEAMDSMVVRVGEAKEKLAQSEALFRMVSEFSTEWIFWRATDGRMVYTSPSCEEITGYTAEEFQSRKDLIEIIILPEDRSICMGHFRDHQDPRPHNPIEYRIRTRDGRIRWISHVCRGIYDSDGNYLGRRGSNRDITARKEAEQQLAMEKERLSVTLRSIGDGVITTDMEGNVVLVNRVAEQLTGWSQEEAAGHPLAEIFRLVHRDTGERLPCPARTILGKKQRIEQEEHGILTCRNGRKHLIADTAAPIHDQDSRIIGVVLVFRDITDRERLENEAIKAQRLESIGTLAGGIAHDFNNLLTAILGNISLLHHHLGQNAGARDYLLAAEQASLRARDLTRQLLTFSRGGAPVKQLVAMDRLLREAADLTMRGSNVRHELRIAADLWSAEVDPGQISQVIGNLLINADQAMPGGGVITISADNVTLADNNLLLLPPGPYVRIRVQDQGTGIAPQHLERIFDPYFTTKSEGNGLGLASSYSIIRNHKGVISVESDPGVGSTFTIHLPASQQRRLEAAQEPPRPEPGQGRILVMDDEEMIRTLCMGILTSLGYEAAGTADGTETLQAYSHAMDNGHPFAAVILDLTIPGGMGGRETARRLLELDPDACLIVSSGYANDMAVSEYRKFGFRAILVKPYQVGDVAAVLRKVLN